ncbi:MAG: hypothetical protein CVT84_15830 [Alphaproteobacteria bacterium HGW-Alphaproteobacteria-6]|nr:MAG: hypothetical protein CVT84_15830 [Alphaproteobacteria bacterium HGW-Alphaproteobacteria-6]
MPNPMPSPCTPPPCARRPGTSPHRPMRQAIAAALRGLIVLVALVLAAPAPPRAETAPETEALAEALQLGALFAVMAAEGADYGEGIEAEMFPGAGGAGWRAAVASIYAPDRQLAVFRSAFDARLAGIGAQVAPVLDFFTTDPGRQIVTLELSARRAFLDEAVEEASRLRFQEAQAAGDARLAVVAEFIAANDLIEANVAGALNANYAFYQGLLDTGGLGPAGPGEDEVIAEVWGQEAAIRDEIELWIHSYLFLAYAPLSDDDLALYLDFSRSAPGQALNAALFAGFDAVFADVSRRLGQAAGQRLSGSDL